MAEANNTFVAAENLGTPIPTAYNYVVRNTPILTVAQRYAVQKSTEFNCFVFPASMLSCDYLSDSGTSSMTDVQWAALFRGDESYGRNHGYYALLDAVRDCFERGDHPQRLVSDILSGEENSTICPCKKDLEQPIEGGFVNGGSMQLLRPNFFIVPQGRCAENLLYSTVRQVLDERCADTKTQHRFLIPSNGFFDTTEAHAHFAHFVPLNLFSPHFHDAFPVEDVAVRNTFKGDIDIERLKHAIETEGAENIPFILMTITNNTGAGQPVSMANLRATADLAKQYDIPVFYDAARFAENAWFIHEFEAGYASKSIPAIVQEMFTYCDAFTMSMKKDALANMGGCLAFRDQGVFHRKFSSVGRDIGVRIKEKQILMYGNDSYGGMSGRDIMAAAVGLSQVVRLSYLSRRCLQAREMAVGMAKAGLPVVLPPGGHAVYLDIDKFFEGLPMTIGDFGGVGIVIELIRLYGIRACELGAFAFEWDQKSDDERQGILNLVRFAIPRNSYNHDHIQYTVDAVAELYKKRHLIPKVTVSRGATLHLRHFQSGLQPHYSYNVEKTITEAPEYMDETPCKRVPLL